MHGRVYPCRRYRPRVEDDDNDQPIGLLLHPSNLVVEPGDELVFTGLLDQYGEPIVRPAREPIGYLWDQFDQDT